MKRKTCESTSSSPAESPSRKTRETLELLFDVTRSISRELTLDRLLLVIAREVKGVLACERCTVFMADQESGELWSRIVEEKNEIRFPGHLGIAGHVATTGEPLNIADAYADPRFNPNIDGETGFRTRSILCSPMRNRLGEIIGVFEVLNKLHGSFNHDDEELLAAISVIAASQIENAQLYEEQKKSFDSFMETLASTIDARDPLTAGHSKRIAMYADELARIAKLGPEEREVLRTSALLHDYGKIAVRETILMKRGHLTEEEFRHIQSHSSYTRSILEKINFSRVLKQVPLIASSHHEKLDGSGYPDGLSGEQIPELGRILAVADVFDALTSQRHYRDRMDFQDVMAILSRGIGIHFDERFVEALRKIKLDRLLLILEVENHNDLDQRSLAFLAQYDTNDLLAAMQNQTPEKDEIQLRSVFLNYYSRSYLREQETEAR